VRIASCARSTVASSPSASVATVPVTPAPSIITTSPNAFTAMIEPVTSSPIRVANSRAESIRTLSCSAFVAARARSLSETDSSSIGEAPATCVRSPDR
jgi:hypothetical protein